MKNLLWISTHYLKKNFLDPKSLILLGLPLVFIFGFRLTAQFLETTVGEYAAMAYIALAIPIVLAFQFFGADGTTSWLHEDLKGPAASRLFVSGIDQRIFYLGVVLASWIFNFVFGMILVAITSITIDKDWGNYGLVILVILLISFLSQLVGVIIFYFSKTEKAGSRYAYFFGEVMTLIAMIPILMPVLFQGIDGEGIVMTVINHFPVGLGLQVIQSDSISGALLPLGILLGLNVVIAVIVLIIGRGKHDSI